MHGCFALVSDTRPPFAQRLALCFLAVVGHGSASGEPVSFVSLKTAFGDAIRYTAGPKPELRYCPDNTCEVFRSSDEKTAENLADFALLYLWRASEYEALRSWQAGPPSKRVQEILEKHGAACRASSPSSPRCALEYLAKRAAVRVAFGRYDAGEYTEVPVDLKGVLNETE